MESFVFGESSLNWRFILWPAVLSGVSFGVRESNSIRFPCWWFSLAVPSVLRRCLLLLLSIAEFVYHFPIALKSDKASPAFSISVLYVRLCSRYVVLFVSRSSGIRSIWNAFSAGSRILATALWFYVRLLIAWCFDCSFSFYIHHFLILLYKNFYINSVRTRCSNHIRFTVI